MYHVHVSTDSTVSETLLVGVAISAAILALSEVGVTWMEGAGV